MAYVHVGLVPEKFRLVFCCPLISFFVSNIKFFLSSGRFPVAHHSHNYPYHKGRCWHSQIRYLSDFRRVQVQQNSSSLRFHWSDYPSLNPWKEKLLHLLVYWYSCLLVQTKMHCDYFHKDSFGLWTVVYFCLHLLKVACDIDLDLVLFFSIFFM